MVNKFQPEANKVYFITKSTLLQILEGTGIIQVDFKNYLDWDDKLIFLDKGQYIKFLSGSFEVRKIVFEDEHILRNTNVRVLFKHLVSLGYINYQECEECQKYLSDTLITSPKDIIDISVNHWYWQNPFNAQMEEYQIIFDLKEVIDKEYKNHLTSEELVRIIGRNNRTIHHLLKDRLGLSVKNLLMRKQMLESQKEVAFTNKPIQSIAYDLGYKDPAYFNRIFNNKVGLTPGNFRDQFDFEPEDVFEQHLFDLISDFHSEHRKLSFYAVKLYMSEKTLTKTVKQKLNTTLGQLIRFEIIKSAKKYLSEDRKIKEIAALLGFEEANHFSTFFKHYTDHTPMEYQSKKYKN